MVIKIHQLIITTKVMVIKIHQLISTTKVMVKKLHQLIITTKEHQNLYYLSVPRENYKKQRKNNYEEFGKKCYTSDVEDNLQHSQQQSIDKQQPINQLNNKINMKQPLLSFYLIHLIFMMMIVVSFHQIETIEQQQPDNFL
jgi:hypothetical protein